MGTYGIIGQHLGHSYSPLIHSHFGYEYHTTELEPNDLANWTARRQWAGYNVTIPYKQSIMPLLDHIDTRASQIGAVNTVVNRDGALTGYNTDFGGMCYALAQAQIALDGRHVLILGTGGTSHTAYAVCRSLGAASITYVSRSGPINYQNVYREASTAQVLINTTPVGMFPLVGTTLIDPLKLPHLESVLDVIPNPLYTELALQARQAGLRTAGGLDMLVGQAVMSRQLFLGDTGALSLSPQEITERFGTDIIQSRKNLMPHIGNVVLVGMPGCGKTVVGRALAAQMGLAFRDTDLEIEAATGQRIEKLITDHGIEWFRAQERDQARQLGSLSGTVIATGGGLATDAQSLHAVAQNGVVIYLRRPLELLETEGRPVSAQNTLDCLFAARDPLYRRFARWTVDNDGTVEECVTAISALVKEVFI